MKKCLSCFLPLARLNSSCLLKLWWVFVCLFTCLYSDRVLFWNKNDQIKWNSKETRKLIKTSWKHYKELKIKKLSGNFFNKYRSQNCILHSIKNGGYSWWIGHDGPPKLNQEHLQFSNNKFYDSTGPLTI